jgi:hypothetical protein
VTTATPFGTVVAAESPFDTDGRCACGAWADLDGTTCEGCFEARWTRPTDPMVELLDALDAPTIPLAA